MVMRSRGDASDAGDEDVVRSTSKSHTRSPAHTPLHTHARACSDEHTHAHQYTHAHQHTHARTGSQCCLVAPHRPSAAQAPKPRCVLLNFTKKSLLTKEISPFCTANCLRYEGKEEDASGTVQFTRVTRCVLGVGRCPSSHSASPCICPRRSSSKCAGRGTLARHCRPRNNLPPSESKCRGLNFLEEALFRVPTFVRQFFSLTFP